MSGKGSLANPLHLDMYSRYFKNINKRHIGDLGYNPHRVFQLFFLASLLALQQTKIRGKTFTLAPTTKPWLHLLILACFEKGVGALPEKSFQPQPSYRLLGGSSNSWLFKLRVLLYYNYYFTATCESPPSNTTQQDDTMYNCF